MPAEVVLRVIELTSVEATWLLHGTGPRFRREATAPTPDLTSVEALLRSALRKLERGEIPLREKASDREADDRDALDDLDQD